MSISDTGSPGRARAAVDAFAVGWQRPSPGAWDHLLADDVELSQPLMPDGVGREHWRREFASLQAFLPDLHGEVAAWARCGSTVFIELVCRATAAGRPLQFRAVDRLTLADDGAVTARTSYFDPLPLLRAVATRPTVWPRWWRSGTAPLTARRAVLARPTTATPTPPLSAPRARDRFSPPRTARWLGAIRTGVGMIALISPRTAYRTMDRRADPPAGGFVARGFGIREVAIATTTLSPRPDRARLGLAMGVLIDSIDAVSFLLGRRKISGRGKLLVGLPAAVFAAVGAAALAGNERLEGPSHQSGRIAA